MLKLITDGLLSGLEDLMFKAPTLYFYTPSPRPARDGTPTASGTGRDSGTYYFQA